MLFFILFKVSRFPKAKKNLLPRMGEKVVKSSSNNLEKNPGSKKTFSNWRR
jgi:hypothetical protein